MYKRTKTDSPLRCPYCDRQFSMNMERYLSYNHRPRFRLNVTECKGCKRSFYYRNISAQGARDLKMRATYTLEEVNGRRELIYGQV